MPGRLFLTQDVATIAAHFHVSVPDFNDPPRLKISPGQEIIVLRQDRQLCRMRWGLIPVGRVNARGRPILETIVNARSETVFEKSAFQGVRRCMFRPAGGTNGPVSRAGKQHGGYRHAQVNCWHLPRSATFGLRPVD